MHERGQSAKIVDMLHHYRGLGSDSGVCRVRIYDTRPPTVVVSELPENHSTSISNAAEFLAAEIISQYLPDCYESEQPVRWIEHYGGPEVRSRRGKSEEFSRVVFETHKARMVQRTDGGQRLAIGTPDWKPIGPEQVRKLIGDEDP